MPYSVISKKMSATSGAEWDLVSKSPLMQRLKHRIRLYSTSEAPILIQGETGSGKEHAARTVHQNSDRCSRPFFAVNCGAIPTELVEAELFGTDEGAFTGAKRRSGWFARANGGTLLLDEIGDMPFAAQTVLLRVLETGELWPVGSENCRKVDVRIICATHRHLRHEVDEGRFRADLFHRISTLILDVPSLRQRTEDMVALARQLFPDHSLNLSPDAWRKLEKHPWPGNVREFKNVLWRALIEAENERITADNIRFDRLTLQERSVKMTAVQPLHEALGAYVRKALNECQGNVRATARALQVSPTTVYRYISLTGRASDNSSVATTD